MIFMDTQLKPMYLHMDLPIINPIFIIISPNLYPNYLILTRKCLDIHHALFSFLLRKLLLLELICSMNLIFLFAIPSNQVCLLTYLKIIQIIIIYNPLTLISKNISLSAQIFWKLLVNIFIWLINIISLKIISILILKYLIKISKKNNY